MNRLFQTLRGIVDRPRATDAEQAERTGQYEQYDQVEQYETGAEESLQEALPNFESRLEVLCSYAERSAAYEDDLTYNYDEVLDQLDQLQQLMERALDEGRDRDALEYLRLAVRIRPQRDLLDHEIRAFHVVANDLITRVNTLMEYVDEAREYARDAALSPAATAFLDATLNRLTRYFVLLERVTRTRHKALPQRLAEQIVLVVDDRQLDLELATYVLQRRRSLGSGR